MKFLIVVDSAAERTMFANLLSEYEIFTAYDSQEAIKILKENEEMNFLILDLNGQNDDRFQVLKYIKEDDRFSQLCAIILTDENDMETESKGLQLGAADYIRRPLHANIVKARMDTHITLFRNRQLLKLLNEQLHRIEKTFDEFPIGIVISKRYAKDLDNETVIKMNSTFADILGRSKKEIKNLSLAEITHQEDLEEEKENLEKIHSGEARFYSMDQRYKKRDGSFVWAHRIVVPLFAEKEDEQTYISLIQDITDCKEMEKALHDIERSQEIFLANLPGLAYICDLDENRTMQYVSEGCFNLTGYPPESLLYNKEISYNDIISPEYRKAIIDEWKHAIENKETFKYEYEIVTANGESKWVLELGQGIYDDNGEIEALAGIILDISDRKEMENTLKYNSEHDQWTGLYNRDYLVSFLKKEMTLNKKMKKALIGINLSAIQRLAANYGFHYSQKLIKKATEALSSYCGEHCLLFYPRENHFIFYLRNYKDRRELLDFGNAVTETLQSIFFVERIAGGIGVLEMDEEEIDIEVLLRRLLIASERYIGLFGKDFKICLYDEKLEALVNRERDIAEILKAIAMDDATNGELFLQYQPIIDLKNGTIFGFEALARLKTEKYGLVPPLEFISIAEKTKLIYPVGEKIIVKALNFLKKLKDRGYEDINVSINISIIQLLNRDFIHWLLKLIDEMGIDKKNIGIEITESVFANDYNHINEIIAKLRKEGLYIAIDDFGTGYSSLARERELNADCMKIDKYFIDDLLNNDLNKAITGDIISMAHKLGHATIAEGVEYKSQLRYLKEHHCDKIQGYLISKPLDEKDAIHFLQNREYEKIMLFNEE